MKVSDFIEEFKRYFSWEESREDIILDHRLTTLYSEIRTWEEEQGIRLPKEFETRLMSKLEESSRECESSFSLSRWFVDFLMNRRVQYGMSLAMVSLLAVVLFTRFNSQFTEDVEDTAGVIIKNTDYLNRPSSVEYADSFHQRKFIEATRSQEGAIETLRHLEAYFLSTGRVGVASEIRFLIQEATR